MLLATKFRAATARQRPPFFKRAPLNRSVALKKLSKFRAKRPELWPAFRAESQLAI
jgi:hypothetical protein